MYILAIGPYYCETPYAYTTAWTLKEAHTLLRAAGYRRKRKHWNERAYYEHEELQRWVRVIAPAQVRELSIENEGV